MTNLKTIVVVGGGYAGINLIEALKREFNKNKVRIILVDKNSFHFKKVKLFKGIVNENVSDLRIPLSDICGSAIEFIQGKLTKINVEEQSVHITRVEGTFVQLGYDKLVLALGSVSREMALECGGVALSNLENAKMIRQHLLKKMDSPMSNLRLAIAGGGMTGIETAAEVGSWLKDEAEKTRINTKVIELFIINDKQRILNEAPMKISEQLENRLTKHGIHLIHNKKAEKFADNKVCFSDKTELEVDFCIWTAGLKPHPILRELSLPLTGEGKIIVDPWYRIVERENIYAIGDCIHVTDPLSGKAAAMSCKEAISQAGRLAKIIKSHDEEYTEAAHKNYQDLLCIGMGSNDGFVWAQKWGVDFVLTGRIANKIREYTWNIASLNH